MSYNWLLIRGASANPSSLKYQALMNKQSIAENELFKPEAQQPQIISVHTEDTVLLQDPFFFRKLRTKTQKYYAPWEPDGVYLKLWARFNHLARQLKEYSMSINLEDFTKIKIYPKGQPKLCEGPDDGVKGGTIVSRINYSPDHIDFFKVLNPAECLIGMQEATTGFSMYLDFMLEGEPVNQNGLNQTIWFHVDDVNGNQGTMVRIGEDRSLQFIARRSGVTRSFVSPANLVQSGLWTKAFLTYDFNGDVMTMRVDRDEQVDSGDQSPGFPTGHENSVYIGVRTNETQGRFVGRVKEARWYRNLIFNNDHKDNLWNNGRSICARNVLTFNSAPNADMQLGNDATLWSKPLSQFAFSFWIYPTIMNDGINRLVARHGNTGYGFECDIDSSVAGQIYFRLRNSDNTVTHEANNGTTGSRLLLNKWNQIICSYNNGGSANGRIYVNGELGSQTFTFTDVINSSNGFELGGPSTDFHGDMADFRWWSNDSFNVVEANAFWNTGVMPSTPDYWLKMNEGNGLPVDYITRTKTVTMDATWKIGSSLRPAGFGSLAVAGYTRFNETVDVGGYDSTGYDSTGFDTT